MKTEQQIREALATLERVLESREEIHAAMSDTGEERFVYAATDEDYEEAVVQFDALLWMLGETPSEEESILAKRLRHLNRANQ